MTAKDKAKTERQPLMIPRTEVQLMLGKSASAVYDLLHRDPQFPKAVRIGPRSIRWWRSEVLDYLATRERVNIGDHQGANDDPSE